MGVVNKRIVQSRTYISDKPQPPPEANYELTYPITTYDAVKSSWDDDAITLAEDIEAIKGKLLGAQRRIPAKPANYLMTYGGVSGEVGSIKYTTAMEWSRDAQSHGRIPTEKAVGDYLHRIGLLDSNGNPKDTKNIHWEDIIGVPFAYRSLGNNTDGFITQNVITEHFKKLTSDLTEVDTKHNTATEEVRKMLIDHIKNDVPPVITPGGIGAVTVEEFRAHANDLNNPHHVSKEQLGLDRVDNTSDLEKPISTATQEALTNISNVLHNLNSAKPGFTDVSYDLEKGLLTLSSTLESKTVTIPLHTLISSITYNANNHNLMTRDLSGKNERTIDLSELHTDIASVDTTTIRMKVTTNTTKSLYTIQSEVEDHSINEHKLAYGSVYTNHLKDNAVSGTKIAPDSIGARHIANASITLNKIVSSTNANRVLGVTTIGSTLQYVRINSEMMDDDAVQENNIAPAAISSRTIRDVAIQSSHIQDNAIRTNHISNASIERIHLKDRIIDGSAIVDSVKLNGTPTISTPIPEVDDKAIINKEFLFNTLRSYTFSNENFVPKTIGVDKLKPSDVSNRVLITEDATKAPSWAKINKDCIDVNAIMNEHLSDNSVSDRTIMDGAVVRRHIRPLSIATEHLMDSSVAPAKLFKSTEADMLLGTLTLNSHPVYTKLTRGMIPPRLITGEEVKDNSVTLDKLQKPENNTSGHQVIAIDRGNTDPVWTKIKNRMIDDNQVDGRTLFTTTERNKVLVVTTPNTPPFYGTINTEMISDGAVASNNLQKHSVREEHIKPLTLSTDHFKLRQIRGEHIVEGTITGSELFPSLNPNRVLGVTDQNIPVNYVKINRDMLEPNIVDGSKLFRARYDHMVIGVYGADQDPRYLKITSDYIRDQSIESKSLERDILLRGMPSLDTTPIEDGKLSNMRITNIQYVKDAIAKALKNYVAPTIHTFNPTQFDEVSNVISLKTSIFDSIIDTKVKAMWNSSPLPNVNGAVSIDNQYFKLTALKVLTFSDAFAQQLKDAAAGIGGNRSIKGNKLFSSDVDNRVLAVQIAGDDPKYVQVNTEMIAADAIRTINIRAGAITADKIASAPVIRNLNIFDQTITGAKIDVNTITGNHIIDKSISPSKLRTDEEYEKIVISPDRPGTHTDRKVHNIIVSAEEPTNAQPGDIWFRVVNW